MRGTVWVENVAFTGHGGGCAPTPTGRGPTRGMRMLSRSTVSLRMAWNVKTVRRPGIFMMVGTSTSIALCRVFAGRLQTLCREFTGRLQARWAPGMSMPSSTIEPTCTRQRLGACCLVARHWIDRALPCGSVVRFFVCLSARLGPALRCRRLFELMRCDDSVHEVAARRDDDVPEATLSDSRLKYPA